MDKGSAQKIIDTLKDLYSIYEYTVSDNKTQDEVRGFRSHLDTKDYKIWCQKEVFEMRMGGNNVTYFSTPSAFKELAAIQLADKNYKNELIAKKLFTPTMDAIEETVFKDIGKLLAACSHLSIITSSVESSMPSYIDLKTGVEYRLYSEQRGIMILYKDKSYLKLDNNDMKLLINRIKINEYQYHRELEEFGLKDKNEIRQEHMQIMTML